MKNFLWNNFKSNPLRLYLGFKFFKPRGVVGAANSQDDNGHGGFIEHPCSRKCEI